MASRTEELLKREDQKPPIAAGGPLNYTVTWRPLVAGELYSFVANADNEAGAVTINGTPVKYSNTDLAVGVILQDQVFFFLYTGTELILQDPANITVIGAPETAAETVYDNSTSGLAGTNVQTAIDELSASLVTDASGLPYDDTLASTGQLNVQDVIDYILVTAIPDVPSTALELPFDNTGTTLVSTNTREAIIEVFNTISPVTSLPADAITVDDTTLSYTAANAQQALESIDNKPVDTLDYLTTTNGGTSGINYALSKTPEPGKLYHIQLFTANQSANITINGFNVEKINAQPLGIGETSDDQVLLCTFDGTKFVIHAALFRLPSATSVSIDGSTSYNNILQVLDGPEGFRPVTHTETTAYITLLELPPSVYGVEISDPEDFNEIMLTDATSAAIRKLSKPEISNAEGFNEIMLTDASNTPIRQLPKPEISDPEDFNEIMVTDATTVGVRQIPNPVIGDAEDFNESMITDATTL